MIVGPDFDFTTLGYDVDADELGFVLEQAYPGTKQHVEYICAHRVKMNSSDRLTPAIIISWRLPQPEPTPDEIAVFVQTFSVELDTFRAARIRAEAMRPLSPRQLWLAAWSIGILKEDVIAKIAEMDDRDVAGRYAIELAEPPTNGYQRDSEAVNALTALMGIPTHELDDLWLWAQTI